MPTEMTIKISKKVHRRLLQYKVTANCKSFDRAIEHLLDQQGA